MFRSIIGRQKNNFVNPDCFKSYTKGQQKPFVNPDWFKNYMEESNRKFITNKVEEFEKCRNCKKENCCKKNLFEIEDLFHSPSSSNTRDHDIKINIFKIIKRNRNLFLLSMVPCGFFLLSRLSSNK
jgi:hypothetical protein